MTDNPPNLHSELWPACPSSSYAALWKRQSMRARHRPSLYLWSPKLFTNGSIPSSIRLLSFAAGSYVQNLLLEHRSGTDLDIQILSRCPLIQRLVLNVANSMDPDIVDADTSSWPTPWEVSVLDEDLLHVFRFVNKWLTHPILRNVTHLHLHAMWHCPATIYLSLPRLTHLSLVHWDHPHSQARQVDDVFVANARRLLSEGKSLEMVLLQSDQVLTGGPCFIRAVWVELAKIEDERLFARPSLTSPEFGELLRSGRTIWDDAKHFKNWRDDVAGLHARRMN